MFHVSLLTFDVFAQLPTQEWVVQYPGPSNDLEGPFLQVDKSGNSYIAGTHVINDSNNILVAKYNTLGVQLWATLYKYPGERCYAPMGLALDTFGNAYVTALFGPSCLGPLNILTLKFSNVNGSVLWEKRFIGQNGKSNVNDLKIDRQNNIYVVGSADSSLLCIKYNINGDTVWVRKWHPPGDGAEGVACAVDDSLNILITGARIHCITFPPPGGCIDTLLTIKYTKDGILRWYRTYTYNTPGNYGKKIVVDQFGSSYIAVWAQVSGFVVYLTTKYDRNGNQQWVAVYDGPGDGINFLNGIDLDRINNAFFVTGGSVTNGVPMAVTIKYNTQTGDSVWVKRSVGNNNGGGGKDIKVDSIGNAYITGSTYNYPTYVPYDIMTFKYTPQGNPVWLVTYNNSSFNGWDNGVDLQLGDNNYLYVLGTSQNSSQVSDYIIIKYNQFSGIIKNSNYIPNKFYLMSYPNPFNSQTEINLGISYNSKVSVKIFDILGRETEALVNNEEIKAGEYKIKWNADNISSGIYFCRINALYKKSNTNQMYTSTIKLVYSK